MTSSKLFRTLFAALGALIIVTMLIPAAPARAQSAVTHSTEVGGTPRSTVLTVVGSGNEYLNYDQGVTESVSWTNLGDNRFTATVDTSAHTSFKVEHPDDWGYTTLTVDPSSLFKACSTTDVWVCQDLSKIDHATAISGTEQQTVITITGTTKTFINLDGGKTLPVTWTATGDYTFTTTVDMTGHPSFKVEHPDAGRDIVPTIDAASPYKACDFGIGWVCRKPVTIAHSTSISGPYTKAVITVVGTGKEYLNLDGGKTLPVTWTSLGENTYTATVDTSAFLAFKVEHPDFAGDVTVTIDAASGFKACSVGTGWVCRKPISVFIPYAAFMALP